MEVELKLLPPRLGSTKKKTMLFSIASSDPPTVIFLFGVRNVGKTYALLYLAEKIGAIYVDLREEAYTKERLEELLRDSKGKPLILDEITYVNFLEDKTVGELPERLMLSFMERFLKRITRYKARVIFTASYSSNHLVFLKSLVRHYAKDLKKPKSAKGREQPYRIHALPRPFLQAYSYLFDKDVKRRKRYYYGFAKYALPSDIDLSGFKYSYIGPKDYENFFGTLDHEVLSKALAVYFIAGGMPQSLKEARRIIENDPSAFGSIEDSAEYLEKVRDLIPIEDVSYLREELGDLGEGKIVEDLKKYLKGLGDPEPKEIKEVLKLVNTYAIIPIRAKFGYEELLERMPWIDTTRTSGEISYVSTDPRIHHALYRFLISDQPPENPSQYLGAVAESAVAITLAYLLGYSQPRVRKLMWLPIFRPRRAGKKNVFSPDFITFVKIDEGARKDLYTAFLVEVKRRSELDEGRIEEVLRPLAYLGYAFGSYPILVMRSKIPVRRIPIRIDEDIPRKLKEAGFGDVDVLLEAHKKAFKRLYDLPTTPYKPPCTRQVNVMSFEYFLSSVIFAAIERVFSLKTRKNGKGLILKLNRPGSSNMVVEGRATFGKLFIEKLYEEVNRPPGQRPKELYLKMGKRSRRCVRCGSTKRLIRKYGLYLCAKCFRELARDMGRRKTGIKR